MPSKLISSLVLLLFLAGSSFAEQVQIDQLPFCWDSDTQQLAPGECFVPPVDSDGDGIPDDQDECPFDPTNTCNEPPPPVDSDGDGIPDDQDECPNDPTNTCNEPPPPPPADAPTLTANPDTIPVGGANVTLAWDTKGLSCTGSGPGVAATPLSGANNQTFFISENSTFRLECEDGSEAIANITVSDAPPPTDSDGDGIPDDQDECPNDPTNTCNEPPPPPGELGDYRGIPSFPSWTEDRNVDAVYTGGNVTANGSASNPHVVTCNNNSITGLANSQMSISGSYINFVDCVFPNGRVQVSGDHIHLDNIHTSDIGKAGFALSGSQIWVSNSSAKDHWASGKDRHGFQVSCGSDYVVFSDIESSGNSGDGFQAGHGCSGARVRNVFIGGAKCDANRENCLDVKYVDGVVFSTARSSGHGKSGEGFESGSDGSAFIFGSDGDSLNAWLIDSVSSDPIGIRVEDGNGAVVLGNTFSGPTAIALQKHGNPLDIRNNSSTSSTFIGRADRAFNFCINAQGNNYTGSINADLQRQAACFTLGGDADISDLEARFQNRFGFPLQ